MSEVDAIVIGSGQGGSPLALEMAKRGKKVVLFERHRPGGSCLNWGCTPSKTFLASAHAAGRARDAQQLGVRAQVEVDFKKVMERVREVRNNFITGLEKRLLVDNLKLVHAEGAFTAENQVEGGGEKFRAPLVVIDTGSSPLAPPVEGLTAISGTSKIFPSGPWSSAADTSASNSDRDSPGWEAGSASSKMTRE